VIRLAPDASALTPALKAKWPHLAELSAYRVRAADLPKVPTALRDQLAISEEDSQGRLRAASGVQIPGVLDDLYANDAALGVTWAGGVPTLRVGRRPRSRSASSSTRTARRRPPRPATR
jgi:pullulanase